MFFHEDLILDFFGDSSFKEEADLGVVDFHHFLDGFIGEVVDDDFFCGLPDHDVLLLQVDAYEFSFVGEVEVVNLGFIGFCVEDGFGVALEFPALDSLVGNAEVFSGLSVLDDYLLELFFLVGEGADFFAALLGADVDLL